MNNIYFILYQQINSIIYSYRSMDNLGSYEQIDGSFQVLPSLTPQQQARMQQQFRQKLQNFYGKNKKYQIDYWYQAIKEYTYNSFSFPLTISQAYVLHCLYYDNQLTENMKQIKENLIKKIDTLLLQHKNQINNGKYFMKLSTRSPKDYCWDYRDQNQFKKAVQNLKKAIQNEKLSNQTSSEEFNNFLYKFFLINSHEKLLIRSGLDFIRIFSKSQRIITDINDLSYLSGSVFEKLKQKTLPQQRKNQKLINVWVRDWDNCSWQQQFRSFYSNYKLTGISQYDQRCYFPHLSSLKKDIADACLNLFQKLKPKLQSIGLDKGVIDFIVKPNSIQVVQINVFDADARASLFNWTQDKQVLQNGPLQIRVLQKQTSISKEYLGSIMGMIDKRSCDVISQALQKSPFQKLWK